MKQEEIDEIMNKVDKKCKFPKHWNDFIDKNSNGLHIIIKDTKAKKLYCTNCNKYFVNKDVKVRDHIVCPKCHKESVVCGMNYYREHREQPVVLAQRMDKKVIIRIFEIYLYFEQDCKKVKRSCIEYARIIPGVGRFMGNNVAINMFGVMRVYHGYKKIHWNEYRGHKYLTDHPTYPYSKKRLVKGTIMEYAPIEQFMKKFSYYHYNYFDVLELAAYGSFELLWNMKLYNLCFYSKALNKNGSFYKRFRVPKTFLEFMQNNNITYRNLMILQMTQKADAKILEKLRHVSINTIRFLIKHEILYSYLNNEIEFSDYDVHTLKEISEFIPLKKLKDYPKGFLSLNIYRDYLQMSKELALNYKSKKDLFPRNLISRHDKLMKKIKTNKDINMHFGVYLRYLELSRYTCSDDKYMIFPAPSIDGLKDEGTQQGNCVGYMYTDSYIQGKTEIYFIRKLSDIAKSFITLEYRDGNIVQKELPHHSRDFTNEQLDFMNKWVGFRQFIEKKEKYKPTASVVKYDLTKLVA